MFWTPMPAGFGGGSDFDPCIEYAENTAHFHAVQKAHSGTRTGRDLTRV